MTRATRYIQSYNDCDDNHVPWMHVEKGRTYTEVRYDFLTCDYHNVRLSRDGHDKIGALMSSYIAAKRAKHLASPGSFYGWIDVRNEYADDCVESIAQIFDENLETGRANK